MDMQSSSIFATPERVAELDRLGDQIAELSAHLDAATARLLDLIREFDARAGWNGVRNRWSYTFPQIRASQAPIPDGPLFLNFTAEKSYPVNYSIRAKDLPPITGTFTVAFEQ
jgi:hypothetical protein